MSSHSHRAIRFAFASIFVAVLIAVSARTAMSQPFSTVHEAAPLLPPAPSRSDLAFEVNVLWPLFPGGLSELKVLVPVRRAAEPDWRGELLLGTYSDFATRFVRADDRYGKVSILAALLGYRQFLRWGLHAEAAINAGWRHETHNVWDDTTLDAFSARLWLMSGYQHEWNPRVYFNVRAGAGIHLLRTDRFASHERKLAPAVDVNVGFRF